MKTFSLFSQGTTILAPTNKAVEKLEKTKIEDIINYEDMAIEVDTGIQKIDRFFK